MNKSKQICKPAITLLVMSAMLCLGSLWSSVQVATAASPKSKVAAALPVPIKISISITIGRAKRKCGGFGICKITLGNVTAEQRTVNAELSSADNGKLQLTLLEKAPEEGRTLFIDEDIPLSSEIAQKLGVKNATIRKGQYAFGGKKSLLNARLTR